MRVCGWSRKAGVRVQDRRPERPKHPTTATRKHSDPRRRFSALPAALANTSTLLTKPTTISLYIRSLYLLTAPPLMHNVRSTERSERCLNVETLEGWGSFSPNSHTLRRKYGTLYVYTHTCTLYIYMYVASLVQNRP